jgi:hypothetical protein
MWDVGCERNLIDSGILLNRFSDSPHPKSSNQGKALMNRTVTLATAALLSVSPLTAQVTNPYATGIRPGDAAVVGIQEFAQLPDIDGVAARMMLLATEPGTRNLFVNDMRGPIYRLTPDGRSVTLFINVSDERWGHRVQSQGRERGVQSFAFHPQFSERGTPGFGKFYTWSDVVDTAPSAASVR